MATTTTCETSANNATTVLISTFALSDLAPPPTTTQLTLTADFPLDSYEKQLASFALPAALPASITSLTLELFTYGYPPGFLALLGSLLPQLTEITLYLQLVAGTTAESFHDAKAFLGTALRNGLQKLKLVDVFVPPDFFPAAAAAGDGDGDRGAWSLRELTLLYTFRSVDREFNERLPAATVPVLLRPGLERLTVRVQPEAADKPGMTPCEGEAGAGVVDALMTWSEAEAARLRRLDLSAFAFDAATIARLASRFCAVTEAAWAVRADGQAEGKRVAMQAAATGKQLRELEVVACPGLGFYGALRRDKDAALGTVLWRREDVEGVAKGAVGLRSVDVSILREPALGFSSWTRNGRADAGWVGEISLGAELTEKERAAIAKREEGTRLEEVE